MPPSKEDSHHCVNFVMNAKCADYPYLGEYVPCAIMVATPLR